jgi:hypothetical protein|tara:strand:+ start:931 stop:1140 length:210 start_codon:yes stop_codon:yes gene_type:complete
MGKRFTFADAKKRILDLEDELAKVQQKAGDVILDTKDNVFTNKELKKIRFLELWSILGPVVGLLIGLIF